MMVLPPGLTHIFAETHLFTDAQSYVILHVALDQAQAVEQVLAQNDALSSSTLFSAFIRDKDEVTVLLPFNTWERLKPMLSVVDASSGYRLITFDISLDLGLVGYMATLTAVLAEQGISIFAISTFSRDHIFVQERDFDRAWEALSHLIRTCQTQENSV
jgi:hypothetical protein